MDSHKPTQPPEQLLDDLESIHDLLYERNEPPLLTESFEPDNIPLLSDVVSPGTAP
ncbi:DNA polymerase III subunit chi, partial [Pseudomonas aeruginosa]